MESIFIFLSFLVILFHGGNFYTPTERPLCPTDLSSAYIDIVFVIDTSANMGSENLQKIANIIPLIIFKLPIANWIDRSTYNSTYKNTRIGIVTYDYQSTVVANFSDIKSVSDVSAKLNSIQASSTTMANIYAGLINASSFWIVNEADREATKNGSNAFCQYGDFCNRPTAIILFAASSNSPNFDQIQQLVGDSSALYGVTFITVNYNPSDQALTCLLDSFSLLTIYSNPLYAYLGSSNTLQQDLEWAISQAHCYCPCPNTGVWPIVLYDSTLGRYSRYAQCIILSILVSGNPWPYVSEQCYTSGVPAFDLSQEKTTYIEAVWKTTYIEAPLYPFYIGLHKDPNNQWSFLDYEFNDFSITNYTNWALGSPNATSGNCGVFDSDDGVHLVWKQISCQVTVENYLPASLCQSIACTPENWADCNQCYGNCSMELAEKIAFKSKIKTHGHGLKAMQNSIFCGNVPTTTTDLTAATGLTMNTTTTEDHKPDPTTTSHNNTIKISSLLIAFVLLTLKL